VHGDGEMVTAGAPVKPGVVTAILRDGDRVLLCHRRPDRRWYPNLWDLPGGHVEPGESRAEALVRELREELGIEIREPTQPPLAMVEGDGFDMWIWLLDSWTGTVSNTAPDEHDDLAWVDVAGLAGLALGDPSYLALLTEVLAG
jgi:8-oxo-dGTP diphosphatase